MRNKPFRTDPIIDMNELARDIAAAGGPDAYAPPDLREDPTLQQIKSFGELPTKEIDEIIATAESELATLKRDAQAVRDMYVKHTTRIASDIKRLQEGVKLSMETMKNLRQQCAALDSPHQPDTDNEKV